MILDRIGAGAVNRVGSTYFMQWLAFVGTTVTLGSAIVTTTNNALVYFPGIFRT